MEKVSDNIKDDIKLRKQDVIEFAGVLDPKVQTPQEKIESRNTTRSLETRSSLRNGFRKGTIVQIIRKNCN